MKSSSKDDWITQVLKEQDKLEINLGFEEIHLMPKLKFKAIVQGKVNEKDFKPL